MLRAINFVLRIASHNRNVVIAANQRRFGEILKCDYATRPVGVLAKYIGTSKATADARGLRKILSIVQKDKVTSQEAFEVLARCNCEAVLHLALMEQIWAELKTKTELEVTHYNFLLEVYLDKDMHFEPVKVLEEMMNGNIEPNWTTFDHLMRAFALQGDVNNFNNILEEMKEKGVTINGSTYNNLILAYANDGNLSRMQDIENLMKQKGFAVQVDTLNAFLTSYAKAGDIEGINRTFERFRELKTVPLNKDVLEVILELHANNHDGLIESVAKRLNKSPELQVALRSIMEKSVRRNIDTIVPKLLPIFDEDDQLWMMRYYVNALRDAPAYRIDNAVIVLENYGFTVQTQPSVFVDGLKSNSPQLIRCVLDDMKARSVPIQNKNFWKLIELESPNILNVVASMIRDYGTNPDIYTIREVILPCMDATADPFLALSLLRSVYPNTWKIVRSLFERCLLDNNMEAAYEVLNDYKSYSYSVTWLKNSLINAFVATGDVHHFVKIVNILQSCMANKKARRSAASETGSSRSLDGEPRQTSASSFTPTIAIGNILRETISHIQTNPRQVESVLRAFVHEGLTISPSVAANIEYFFKNALNTNAVKLLNTLSSGELTPVSMEMNGKRHETLTLLTPNELQKQIEIEEMRGGDASALKLIQFRAYVKKKNVSEVNEMMKTCKLSNADHWKVIKMHLEMGNTADALGYWEQVRKTNPDFFLYRIGVGKLARAMLKAEYEWSEIIQIFTKNKQAQPPTEIVNEIHLFLRDVSEMVKAAQFKELTTILAENNFLFENNRTTGLLIKAHLINNNPSEALRIFEKQSREKNDTSGSVPLMRAFIQADDLEKLETVFDIVVRKQSEDTAVLQLTQSYIQTDNLPLARAVMMNNLSRNPEISFLKQCEICYQQNQCSEMEGWIKATEDMEYDRSDIYYYLMMLYCKRGEFQKAIDLWEKVLAEEVQPNDNEFLDTLESLLRKNGIKVLFPMETSTDAPLNRRVDGHSTSAGEIEKQNGINSPASRDETPIRRVIAQPSRESPVKLAPQSALENALRNGDADVALQEWTKINSHSVHYVTLGGRLIRLLTEEDRDTAAVDVATQISKSGKPVFLRLLRDLAERLAAKGDTQSLDRLSDSLPRTVKGYIQFNNINLQAYQKCGKWNEFFATILEKLDHAPTEETMRDLNIRMISANLLHLLHNKTIPSDEFKEFANKAADRGLYGPLNVLWAQNFLNDSPETSSIVARLEQVSPSKIYISFLARYLVGIENKEKLQQLKEFVKLKNSNELHTINRIILDWHVHEDRIPEALAMIENGTVSYHQLSLEILRKLRNRFIANGDPLPDCISPGKPKKK